MASTSAPTCLEDRLANTVLQECCQDIVNYVNIDEIILPMHAKGRLTLEELNRLNSISMTDQEKKRLFYTIALADKGSEAFEDFIAVLQQSPGNYKPHDDLVSKLTQSHELHSRDYSHMRKQPNEHCQAPEAKKKKTDMTSATSEMGSEASTELSLDTRSEPKFRDTSLEQESERRSENNSGLSSEPKSDMRSETRSEPKSETTSESSAELQSEMSSDSGLMSVVDDVLSPATTHKVSHVVFVFAF